MRFQARIEICNIRSEMTCKFFLIFSYKFPRLAAEYRPIWANKKFGEEFGDAIHDQHLVPIQTMSTFGSKIDNSGKNADLNTLNYAKDFDSYRKINYNSENNS